MALLTWQVLTRLDVMSLIALTMWDVKPDIAYIVDSAWTVCGVCVAAGK